MGKIAIFGIGGVGSLVARALAAAPEISEISVFAGNAAKLRAEAMDLRIAAENAGNERITIRAEMLDLFDHDRTSTMLAAIRPDVLVNTATMRSWFAIASALPQPVWRKLYSASRFGPWLPINLAPAVCFMRAARAACPDAATINVAFPDGINPILHGMGLTPTLGAGNSEILHSVLRISAAEMLGVPVAEIDAELIGHHFHLANLDHDTAWTDRAFWYRLHHNGRDVTEELSARGFQAVMRRNCPHKSPVPAAVSTAKNTRRLLGADAGRRVHCSAPAGLGGGTEVVFMDGWPAITLPEGVTAERRDTILARAMQAEGIDAILPDGRIRFGTAEAEAMRAQLGYDVTILDPAEAEARGHELLARFDEIAARTPEA
ncbi:MAG: hypothetical protein QM682_17200 [Paracoccus sp. (in: a-proteobacteria)]|uniref:hypothetical protein n=1 Tax=Paracoccus sp. TaxID=267 RepID=UPI0039E325DB